MKGKTKKILLMGICLLISLIIVFFLITKNITYHNGSIPPTIYYVTINRITKHVYIKEYNACSMGDGCEGSYEYFSGKLTNEEYKKIKKIWNKKCSGIFTRCEERNLLVLSLEDICLGDKVFLKSAKDAQKKWYTVEEYTSMDINGDGKVTYRERGEDLLNEVGD